MVMTANGTSTPASAEREPTIIREPRVYLVGRQVMDRTALDEFRPRRLHDPSVLHPGGTCGLASTALQAQIEVAHQRHRGFSASRRHRIDERDPAAG